MREIFDVHALDCVSVELSARECSSFISRRSRHPDRSQTHNRSYKLW